ncbi:MAG: hypothetical protein R3C53_12800 [Pirellulaceae bacterium]
MTTKVPTFLIALFVVGFGLSASSTPAAAWDASDATEALRTGQQLVKDQNWKEATDRLLLVLENDDATGDDVVASLKSLDICRRQLGAVDATDQQLGLAIEHHGNDYRVLSEAARQIVNSYHFGVVADQEFIRGYGGLDGSAGTQVDVQLQDWLQAVGWLRRAIAAAEAEGLQATSQEIGKLYLQFAEVWLGQRSNRRAWQLTSLTDISQELVYTNVDPITHAPLRAAPVDRSGQPILHALPESWELAQTDGERLRWLLKQAEQSPATAWEARLKWAQFLESQFSVKTLQAYGWGRRRSNNKPSDQFALHTLAENETLAQLANGVRRFELPDEHNPIRVFQQISAADAPRGYRSPQATAAYALVDIFLDRRQYTQAEKLLRAALDKFADFPQGQKRRIARQYCPAASAI